MDVQALWEVLRRCAETHGNTSAMEVRHVWQEDYQSASGSEDFLGAAVFTLAAASLQGKTLLEREDSIIGVEMCMGLAAQHLDEAGQRRLQQTVLERTLRRLDQTGEEMAAKASSELLQRGLLTTPKECTQPLRSLLALLVRCIGQDKISAQELLDLCGADVALAVAVIAEALIAPRPPGLSLWPLQLCSLLQQLTSPDVFAWLMQRAEPTLDFNEIPMASFRARQLAHSQVIALSYVQFDVLGRALHAAEEQSQRQAVLAALIRALQSLIGSVDLAGPGRLLSRCMALDFMRLGFRFIAPFGRKLIEECHAAETAKLLRLLCRTFCWLLLHAEFDGSMFLSDSFKPVAAEWLMRANKKPDAQSKTLLALSILAANCGVGTSAPTGVQLHDALERLSRDSYLDLEVELHRWSAYTQQGVESFSHMGYFVSPAVAPDQRVEIDSEDEDWPGNIGVEWHLEGATPPPPAEGRPCAECGKQTAEGQCGEGYFEGLWYCNNCWDMWQDAPPEAVTISPWPLEPGVAEGEAKEQRGAAALLLQAPGTLRCGISGMLMMDPVYIPSSNSTQYPVAFSRRCLEKWHRRAGGRCPLTGAPMDLKDASDASDVTAALSLRRDGTRVVFSLVLFL